MYLFDGARTANITAEVSGVSRRRLAQQMGAVTLATLAGSDAAPYPVNALRNLAIGAVTTSHFVLCDVDLWPSAGLYAALRRLPAAYLREQAHALVIPAFEIASHAFVPLGVDGVPDSLESLRLCSRSKLCDVFKHSTDTHRAPPLRTNRFSHEPHCTSPLAHVNVPLDPLPTKRRPLRHTRRTDSSWYQRWWRLSPPGSASLEGGDVPEAYKVPCFDTIRYEPYLLVPNAPLTPRFDERFVGYGKNKIQFVQHLRLSGFQFFVLPRAFVIHVPHTYSKSRHVWSDANRAKKNQLFINVMSQMMNNGGTIRVPLCMKALIEMSQDEYA